MPVRATLMAPNGYLHAGSLVTLADTLCGYGCLLNLPDGASGFTTVELKSNHLGTTLDGTVAATATPAHLGRTTQVWDAVSRTCRAAARWCCSAARRCCCTRRRAVDARARALTLPSKPCGPAAAGFEFDRKDRSVRRAGRS